MRSTYLAVLLFAFSLVSCGTLGGSFDQPSAAAVRAEASTFAALAPAVFSFVATDAARPLAERAPAAGRAAPEGRTNAELGSILGLLSDWSFRLELNASAAGVDTPTDLPFGLEALKSALEAPVVVPTEAGQ